jgi:tripartite-type tricarboxylate transporter receptor subunit TctC
LHPSADYHPSTDLTPVARFAVVPYVLVVHSSVPANNVKELIALAKARPAQLNFASAGTGSLPHLAGELFKMIAAVDIVHVPYKGAAPASNDLLGGHVQLSFSGITGMAAAIKAGKVRAIAVTMRERSALLPDVQTAHESGLPGLDVSSSLGILAPTKTPTPIVYRLYGEIAKIVEGSDMKKFILSQGAEPALMDGLQFAGYIKAETAKWKRVISTANVKAD